jgi:hypothetical protein
MMAVGSTAIQRPVSAGQGISFWIQKKVVRVTRVSGPVLGIGLCLLGLMPLFLQ